jgi:hypothetical protein
MLTAILTITLLASLFGLLLGFTTTLVNPSTSYRIPPDGVSDRRFSDTAGLVM